jgi:hypothetical protein
MLAVKNIGQQDPKADINYHTNINFDKVTFNSLMNEFRPEPAAKVTEQHNYQKDINDQRYSRSEKEITRRPESTEGQNKIDDRRFENRSDEINNKPEEPEMTAETDGQEYTNGSGEMNGIKDEPEQNTETNDQTAGSGTAVTENNTVQSDDTETNQDKGVNAGAFLYAMANSFAEQINNDSQTAVNESTVQADGKGAENGMKTGALLFDMAEGLANQNKTAVNEGIVQAENGLKAGALLKELMKNNNPATVQTQQTQVNENENTEVLNNDQTKSEKGLKLGSLLFALSNNNVNEKAVDEKLINSQVKAADTTADDLKGSDKGLFNHSKKNSDVKQNIVSEFKVQGETAADYIEENINARTLSSRAMSGFAENLNRQGGPRNLSDNSPKTVRVNTESNNNSLQGSSSVAHESGKINEGLQVARAARPSAFQEIAEKIIYVMKGNSRIGVTVESEAFGKLNMNLSMNKGMVNVHINAVDNATREMVENNINNIIESLSKNGVSVGGFSVGLKNHRNSDGSGHGNTNGRRDDITVERGQENEYVKAGMYAGANNGLVSVFA